MASVTSGPQTSNVAAPAEGSASPASRLAWLDALRGFAALCVVFDHGSQLLLKPVRDLLYHWLNLGQFGVFVFFLVSGYIVPASLERKGSIKTFWISRAFRLFPMYLVVLVLSALAYETGRGNFEGATHSPATAAASWPLMLSNVLSGPNVPNTTWTLSYEMAFYLLLVALFSWRVHRHSGAFAMAFAVGAVALGGVLPMWALQRWGRHGGPSPLTVDIAADVAIIVGIVLALSGKSLVSRIGASVAALTGLVLITLNQSYPYPWSGLTILALMFTGTLIYRAEQGQAGKLTAAWVAGTVLTLLIVAGVWHGTQQHRNEHWSIQWISSIALAAAVFAIGLAVRNRRLPRFAAWLGLVSYSIYLLHPIVFSAYSTFPRLHRNIGTVDQVLLVVALVAVILAASAVTYYTVERPMQRLGRRLARGRRIARAAAQSPPPVPDR